MIFSLSCLSCNLFEEAHTPLCSVVEVVLVWLIGCQVLNTICVGNESCSSHNQSTSDFDVVLGVVDKGRLQS